MKTSFQKEISIVNELEEVEKVEYREGLYNRMGQGKFLPALIVENQVTLKGTVNSRLKETLTTDRDKGRRAPDEGTPRKNTMLLEA
jgi:hypothetical protein